jgi:signal transduction histidine kinase
MAQKTDSGDVILLVEDDRIFGTLVSEILGARGLKVEQASSGNEAFHLVSGGRYSLLLLDYTLSDMNAALLIDAMREAGLLVPPFIITTGAGDEHIAVQMMKRGAEDYIVKDANFLTVLPEVVAKAIEHIVGERARIEAERRLKESEEGRRAMEKRLVQSQKLESLGVLAGGIAHDFNNILMAIIGNADLAMMDLPADSQARECIAEIEKAAKKARDVCKSMLAYAGRDSMETGEADVSRLVADMKGMLELSAGAGNTLRLELAKGLPSAVLDASLFSQIVLNLIINASEASGEGRGMITIRTGVRECGKDFLASTWLKEDLAEGKYVFVEVADKGCGISPENLQRIFDPFFTTKFMGRGLGLAAVLGTVKRHKGAIRVESEPGKGTTIQVFFPTAETELNAAF